jgi:Ca2+-binding RTX toxin-like protein
MLAAAVLATTTLVVPPPASSVEVMTADSCRGDLACDKYAQGHPVRVTTFVSGPGEANAVTVSREGGELVFRHGTAWVSAVAPCRRDGAETIRCPVTEGEPGIPGLAFAMDDRDDAVTVAGDLAIEARIAAGAGDDRVRGGDGNEEMDGGPGNDRLAAGRGFDVLSYESRTEPVAVDLENAEGLAAGETDAVWGFETVVGGSAADRLRGRAGVQTLDGGPGDDRLDGAGGDDELFGNVGSDRIFGGRGADRLFGDPEQGDDYYTPTFAFGADRLSGGAGDDQLYDTGGRNVFLGGPGADLLAGGAGRDRFSAGAGRDSVDAVGGGRDRVRCGGGRDRARTDRRDTRSSCERPWPAGT